MLWDLNGIQMKFIQPILKRSKIVQIMKFKIEGVVTTNM